MSNKALDWKKLQRTVKRTEAIESFKKSGSVDMDSWTAGHSKLERRRADINDIRRLKECRTFDALNRGVMTPARLAFVLRMLAFSRRRPLMLTEKEAKYIKTLHAIYVTKTITEPGGWRPKG